jgi:dienelactone hydrolase
MRVVVPQCPAESRWTDHLDALSILAETAGAPLALTGFSMGGQGVWAFAAKYPMLVERLAPIAARLPAGMSAEALADRLPDAPIWVVHGARDEKVPMTESEAIVAALDARGRRPVFTRYERLGHVATCDRVYSNPDFLAWLALGRAM